MPSPLSFTTIPLPPPPPPPPPPPSKWGPYSSSKDFDANMAALVLVLVCAAALAFALHAALRLLIRRRRPQSTPRDPAKPPAEATPPHPPLPGSVVAFAAGATALAGAPECAICLAELAEGEPVRVIPACGHGFHALCVDAWLLGRASCPTCRTECRPADAEP